MGRRTVVLAVALVLAGLAALAVWNFLSNVEADVRGEVSLVPVFRASVLIQEGSVGDDVLSQNRFAESQEEKQFMPRNAITSMEELQATLIGRLAAGPISAKQVLTTDQWVEITAEVQPLSELIPEGKQAISVQVDEVKGVGGFVQPNDRINLIVSIVSQAEASGSSDSGGEPPPEEQASTIEITRFVLQGIKVLAVGREIRTAAGEEVTVPTTTPDGQTDEQAEEPVFVDIYTLEVTAEEAEKIAFSFQNGDVWFTLVPEDFVAAPTDGITQDNLFTAE